MTVERLATRRLPDYGGGMRSTTVWTSPTSTLTTFHPSEPVTPFVYDDGGRADAGYSGTAGDCVARAIAIAARLPYQDVYDRLADGNATQRRTSRTAKSSGKRSARNGIHVKRLWFKDYMRSLGFEWTPTMAIGQGCTTHLRADELPAGRLVVAVSKHYTAVLDGVIHDTHDPSRDGTRCVYGYWTLGGGA